MKVTTTLSDQVVDFNCAGSATNKNSPSSSPSRHCLIHEFGDLGMPLAVAQLGHVQEHPLELQWTLSSPGELQWNLNRAPVQMKLKFSSGTPVNPLHVSCVTYHVSGVTCHLSPVTCQNICYDFSISYFFFK